MARRSLAAALAALLFCATASTASAYSTTDIYHGYYANGTTPLAQSFAAAKAALNGLQLRCALITLLQNNTWFPDNGAAAPLQLPPPPLRCVRATGATEPRGLNGWA